MTAWTPTNARLIGYITANTANTTYTAVFNLDALGIQLPPHFSIGIFNASGGALDSTAANHSVVVQRIFKDVV